MSSASARVRVFGDTEIPRPSSSVMAIVSPVTVTPESVPSTLRDSSLSSRASSVGVRVKVLAPLDAPAAISTLKPVTAS